MSTDAGLTATQMLEAASEVLSANGYFEARSENGKDARVFEDPYAIVGLFTFDTWDELSSSWGDAQGVMVDLMSRHFRRAEPKAWEGYAVLMTPSPTPLRARDELERLRYNTHRVRKLIGTGDEIRTLDDVHAALLPVLPIEVERPVASGAALVERLPSMLADRGIPASYTESVVAAFLEGSSLLEELHRVRAGQ